KVNFTVSLNVAGGANPAKSQAIHFEEFVAVFALGGPDEVYIGDQLSLQKLEYSKKEVQAGWTLRMNMRAVASTDNADNVITVWDNGVAVGEERVWHSLNSAVDATGSFSEGACRPIQVRLTDNLTPGIHVVYLSRTWKGETIYTQPVVINLMAGMSETGIYVSDLYWWHWNSRVGGGQADEMYFRSLNDMSGYTVWIWPSKKSIMRFTIHGANAAELENVRVGYNTQESRGARTSNHGWVIWWVPVYRTAPCKCIYAGDENAKVSIWEFEKEEYLGYIEDFEFCFDVRPSQLDKAKSMTEEERRQAELELYFEADGLGEVPDDTELVNALNNLGNDQLQEIRASAQEESALLPDYLQNLDLKTVKNDASGYEVKLNKATDQVKEYSVSMSAGGDVKVWDVWDLMDEEREIMEEKGNVDGWQVSWGETDGIQGSTLIRIAQKKYQDAQGLWHTEINRRFYVTAAVADAIEKGTSIAEAQAVRKAQSAMSSRDALQAVRKRDTARPNAPVYDYGDPPDHWTKKTYDFSTTTVTVADMAQDVYVDALKATYSDPVKGAIEGEKAKFLPKCTSNVMNVLGVAETVIQLRNGP
ncbi:MAG: hypothetical protein J6U63_02585, partial [Clostridia bacterium]|nr:hypothetical protein [Clostridia bacterium]